MGDDEPADSKSATAPDEACCDPSELLEPDTPATAEEPPELAGNDPNTELDPTPPDATESERAEDDAPIEANEVDPLDELEELDELDEEEELRDELELDEGAAGGPPPPSPPPTGQQGQPA